MQRLTQAEEQIMQIIWEIAPCSVGQIMDKLGPPRPPHSTISSIVRILNKKGFLQHEAYGRTFVYRPKIKKSSYMRSFLKDLVHKYFSDSPAHLVSFLVKQNDLDPKELNDLIDQLKNKES